MKRYILLLFLIAGFVYGQASNQAVYRRDSLTVFTTPTQVKGLIRDSISSIVIPDSLKDLASDAIHRTVTDSEKTVWNAKLDKSDSTDATSYTTKKQFNDGQVLKANLISPSFTTPDIGDATGDSLAINKLNISDRVGGYGNWASIVTGNFAAAVGNDHTISSDFSSAFGLGHTISASTSHAFGANVTITSYRAFGMGYYSLLKSPESALFGTMDSVYATNSYGNNYVMGKRNIIGKTNPTGTFGNWLFGSYLRSENPGVWAFGADDTFESLLIPFAGSIVFVNEGIIHWGSNPLANLYSYMPPSYGIQSPHVKDSLRFSFKYQKYGSANDAEAHAGLHYELHRKFNISSTGAIGHEGRTIKRLYSINQNDDDAWHFNTYNTTNRPFAPVYIDSADFIVSAGNINIPNGVVDADSFKISGANVLPRLWTQSGTAIASNQVAPYLIHSFTTTQRDSWTPANGWLFRNSTLSAYQIYESGWQTLASGEWTETNFIGKTDTTDYVRYVTSTAGYVPYASRAGVLSNAGLFYDGTNYGIGTTNPVGKLDVRGYINCDVLNSYTVNDPLELQYGIAGDVIIHGTDSNLQVQGTGNSYFSGYVGIGTTNPSQLLEVNGIIAATNIYPITDNTYYLGKNDDDTPFAYKGIILKDQAGTGKYYRLEIYNDSLRIVDLTD